MHMHYIANNAKMTKNQLKFDKEVFINFFFVILLLFQTKTMLGDHLTNVGINRDNVSEVLQMYMGAHCANTELAPLALSLKTKAFQAHTPAQKASILGFLANELACSKTVIR